VTCAPEAVPPALVDQLQEGGRMLIPVGAGEQFLLVLQKQNGQLRERSRLAVRFVPMIDRAEQARRGF
ncbi:MAG TPA: protein-L-isoaspartate O-methyltransferase, partial [Dongiaceae bacterium]|nr:protein-L-isoaspartate O-methyltransferase [Dongiaceae bacterium]